jgi:hypothetical protein
MKSAMIIALISSFNVFASDVPTEVTLREIAKKSQNSVTLLEVVDNQTSTEINNSNRNIEKDLSVLNSKEAKTVTK